MTGFRFASAATFLSMDFVLLQVSLAVAEEQLISLDACIHSCSIIRVVDPGDTPSGRDVQDEVRILLILLQHCNAPNVLQNLTTFFLIFNHPTGVGSSSTGWHRKLHSDQPRGPELGPAAVLAARQRSSGACAACHLDPCRPCLCRSRSRPLHDPPPILQRSAASNDV